jgi:hypothetical protein
MRASGVAAGPASTSRVPASGRPEGGQALPLTFAMTDLRLVNGAGQKTSLLTAGGCGYCSGLDKI